MPNFTKFAEQKLQERGSIHLGGEEKFSEEKGESKTSDLSEVKLDPSEAKLDLSEVTKILQDDLDRQIVSPDSGLREYYDFYKALDDDKASYQQQYVGAGKAAKQDELRSKAHEFFALIKAKHSANKDAINLLEKDLTKKINADVDDQVAMVVPYLMLQTITYFDQIDKIQDSETKRHFLSQFPMGTEEEYMCVGGFSTRLNPILMILNSENVHLTSAHQSAVSSSNLNRGNSVHQQAMMSALFGINLKDEHYLFPAEMCTAQELWQGYLEYHVKLQEQFLLQQEQVRSDVIGLAKLFENLEEQFDNSKNIKKLKEEFSLNVADFYGYDEDYVPIGIDGEKVKAELEKRAKNYYPKGIDLPITLQGSEVAIKDFSAPITSKTIIDILHNSEFSQSEKNVALNYLWIRAVKGINDSNTTSILSKVTEEDLLKLPIETITDEEIKSFFEQKEQQSLTTLEQIASVDNSTLSQDKLCLIKDKLVSDKISGKQDLLTYAAQNGQSEVVEKLLAAQVIDVNHSDQDGYTALMIAAENDQSEVVEKLLAAQGIDVNHSDQDGRTALMIAAEKGYLKVVEKFLVAQEQGIDVNFVHRSGFTALMIAAQNDHPEVVEKLLVAQGQRIDVNFVHRDAFNALMIAAENGHSEVVEKLLVDQGQGIGVNFIHENRYTALTIAAEKGHLKVVEKLLAAEGTDVNHANKNGSTALMIAAQHGHPEVVEKLLAAQGIDVNLGNRYGYTALMLAARFAARQDHSEVVDKIVKKLCKDGVDTKDIAYIAGDRPKIFSDADKISSFANQICSFIKPNFNFSAAGQKKLERLVRKSLFQEIFTQDNERNIDSITAHFAQDEFKERIAGAILASLQSSGGVIQSSKSILSLPPFNNLKTLNTEHKAIEGLVRGTIKELIEQVMAPSPHGIYYQCGVGLKSKEIGDSRG
jgi:ankyrin repeat protein